MPKPTYTLRVRLTPAQLAALKAAAGREHRTVSQYVRLKCGVEGKP